MNERPPLAALLPHGPEACCIESVLEFDPGGRLVAAARARPGLVLHDERRGGIPAWASIEMMAQAAGVYLGLVATQPRAAHGYLLGVRRFRARREVLPSGSELALEACCRVRGTEGIGRFECRILVGGEEAVSALLTVWRVSGD